MKSKKRKTLPRMKPSVIGVIGGFFCILCERWLDINKFNKDKSTKLGYTLRCKSCLCKYARKHERYKKYSMTETEFRWLEKKQNNQCQICGKEFGKNTNIRHIDHNHKTNEVRGFLCVNCNLGLGNFQDNPELLNKAIYYLNNSIALKMQQEINDIFLSELDKSLGPNDFLDR